MVAIAPIRVLGAGGHKLMPIFSAWLVALLEEAVRVVGAGRGEEGWGGVNVVRVDAEDGACRDGGAAGQLEGLASDAVERDYISLASLCQRETLR